MGLQVPMVDRKVLLEQLDLQEHKDQQDQQDDKDLQAL